MSYKQWNNAFVNYFFKENKDEEILLYVDETVINKIGKNNELGGISDFLKAIIVNNDNRKLIYGNNIDRVPNGNVEFNRRIQHGSIFEFAIFLSEHKNPKTKLPFLNYVILAIYAYSDLEVTNSSYYRNLNSLIRCINEEQRKISSNNIKLDILFENIELFDSRFKNVLIGNLAFMGLLKYQIVLSPNEKYEFEETLFKHKITISEDSNYHLFANKFLSVLSNQYNTLREKIRLGGSEPVYARWFLNKAKNFSPGNFLASNPNVTVGKQVGEIAIVFNPKGEKHLYLSINTAGTGNIKIKEYNFFLDEKTEDGFSTYPVLLNNKKEVSFKKYDNIETEDYKFSFSPLKGVNFFQLNSLNHYQQVINPIANTPTYIIVKNDTKEINKWKDWKYKYTDKCSEALDLTLTQALFTEDYILYFADSINKEYYTRNTNIAAIDYSKELYIKKIGGYKLKSVNTYFDVSLPSFKIQNPVGSDEELKVIVKTNGNKDRDIKYHTLQNNTVELFLSTDKVILKAQQIDITFKLRKLIKEFSFIVIPSEIKATPLDSLFKLNGWGGVKSNSEEIWYNGNEIKGSDKIKISNGRHELIGLKDNHNLHNNYFIYLLSALSNKKDSSELSYLDISSLISLTKVYYDINNIDYLTDDCTNRNIIRNLVALEYLNKKKNDMGESTFQILPPSLLKLERSFTPGGSQIYKLSGVRSRRLDQVIEEFCNNNNVTIKYLDFNKTIQQPLEHLILPSLLFLGSTINIQNLAEFIEDEIGIHLLLQDNHHIGDSLLNFIKSVNSFEESFLRESEGNYENQSFDEGDTNLLPRIIESDSYFKRRGNTYKKKYLRISNNNSQGIYSEDEILINWAKLYVTHKQKKVILFLKQPQWNGKINNFYPEVLIPKTVTIPSMLYRALTSINHGIPETLKGFIINADDINIQRKRFIYLDSYHIGPKPERRENISRILTGDTNVLDNDQVAFYNDYSSNISMHYIECTTFSSVSTLVLFKDRNKIIALCDNYKNVYFSSESGKEIKIDDKIIKVEKLNKGNQTINQIFSQIISKKTDGFEFAAIRDNELIAETIKEEKIRILNLKANAN
ncbi:hypothetical protein OAQ00_02320 [Flavobacteriaceae bacterium]|nr:hypothetical protein [Flavobacteriaceae bacterium]